MALAAHLPTCSIYVLSQLHRVSHVAGVSTSSFPQLSIRGRALSGSWEASIVRKGGAREKCDELRFKLVQHCCRATARFPALTSPLLSTVALCAADQQVLLNGQQFMSCALCVFELPTSARRACAERKKRGGGEASGEEETKKQKRQQQANEQETIPTTHQITRQITGVRVTCLVITCLVIICLVITL